MSEPIDRLSALFERFRVRASLFHSGTLCGINEFEPVAGRGFLHVLRQGQLDVSHPGLTGRIHVRGPSLLLYPRAQAHVFHGAPTEGADFLCATLAFEGGDQHPVARTLPPWLILPLARIRGLEATLGLLFDESGEGRCGQRLMIDRLFEVLLLQIIRWLLNHPDESGVPSGMLAGLAHPQLARVLTSLHEHPGQPWDLHGMAAIANMSRSAFAETFRNTVATTPADYLAQLRVMLAQQKLRSGLSIKLIADQLGYASASSLSRAFTGQAGCSPREWLKRVTPSRREPQ